MNSLAQHAHAIEEALTDESGRTVVRGHTVVSHAEVMQHASVRALIVALERRYTPLVRAMDERATLDGWLALQQARRGSE